MSKNKEEEEVRKEVLRELGGLGAMLAALNEEVSAPTEKEEDTDDQP